MNLLEVKNVKGGYGGEDIVKGIDLICNKNELVVIVGPNGAGKSTFLKMMAGLVSYHTGSIEVSGNSLRSGDIKGVVNAGIGFVPQEHNVFPSMTVKENLEMGCYQQPQHTKKRLEEQLERFPLLKDKLRLQARTLSGGQRQTLALAVSLMMAPSILLLDEPSAGLSPVAASFMFETVKQLTQEGFGIVMIEQNALAALEVADRGVVLVMGEKKRDMQAQALVEDAEIRNLFLGG